MSLFRSDAQRNEVCATLCHWTRQAQLWTQWPSTGPSDRAWRLVGGGWTPGNAESSVARIAVALWAGRGELRFGDLLSEMAPDDRNAVDDLLEALLGGPDAVDLWTENHGNEGVDVDGVAALRVSAPGLAAV